MLFYFSNENIREFNEISRSENSLIFILWEYPRIQLDFSVSECSTISTLRISENLPRLLSRDLQLNLWIDSFCIEIKILHWICNSIEKIRGLNEISRSENSLIFFHWEYPWIQWDFSVRECSSVTQMRISGNFTRFLGQRMLYYFLIENFRELNEISLSKNALLFLYWEISRIKRDYWVRDCSSISLLRISEN